MMRIPCENCGYFPEQHSIVGNCPSPQSTKHFILYSEARYEPALIDIHTKAAMEVFGGSPDAITPDMRYIGKIINYGRMYGYR